ncbi:mannonate dehydratase [Sphingobacterium bovistauri]|uniref:Mannonate dehydratase n=1 Tax=Sphingobacterium bovistauri TaxID=2781959 RepID=A0ABS7Z6J5_9SPHI|nr:mannonate dehydratase [Sphingobacterium bovistauri]MCA5004480.1 mannonate dehydratase [Sphingobacterium bovistauri]
MSKRKLEQTWRWYGPNDPVSLSDVKQAGATGIVSALHYINHGDVWPIEDILERKNIVENAGLTWSVVESVPIHESIKTRAEDAGVYIENYKQTLRNLASCGIYTVCYNFMPVLDWTRTDLAYEMKDGSTALYFNWIDLALFDIYILKREGAKNDYSEYILQQVEEKNKSLTSEELSDLSKTILMGIPTEKEILLEDLTKSINVYNNMGEEGLKDNLIWFLSEIADICEEAGIKMTIHPDDPPFPILGLPRVVKNIDNYRAILEGVNKPFNGFCFCTGSLGANRDNDLLSIFELIKDRVYFTHLRNVKIDEIGNFYEADHLDGNVDMYKVMKALVAENQNREVPIPFRPDHGHQMLDDLKKVTNPGYSAIGRLRGLAELRGLELGILGS